MTPLPHRYMVTARGGPAADIALESRGLPAVRSAAPPEFGGPGDVWSPETLLVAAVADCLVLTFRAVAKAAALPWVGVQFEVEGTLDRVDRGMEFTRFRVHAVLEVADRAAAERAEPVLEKTERTCLVTRSLKAASTLTTTVRVASPAAA